MVVVVVEVVYDKPVITAHNGADTAQEQLPEMRRVRLEIVGLCNDHISIPPIVAI